MEEFEKERNERGFVLFLQNLKGVVWPYLLFDNPLDELTTESQIKV